MHTFLNIYFLNIVIKIDYRDNFVNSINLALEVTKQWFSRYICWKFSIWFNFDSENTIILFYFRYFCSKNRTSRNFNHFIDIPYLISQKFVHNCFLSDIADKFLYWSETPILLCPPLFSHLCPLFSTFNYLKTRFFTRDVNYFPSYT